MGQAKQRGNFEERKEQALAKSELSEELGQIEQACIDNDEEALGDIIGHLSPYFRVAWVSAKHEIEHDYESEIIGFECNIEVSLTTEKDYEYITFESDNAFEMVDIAKAHAAMLELRDDDNPNPSNRTYIIKYANGEGNAITFEYAQTEEGKKALAFAKAAGEEVLLLDTDDAFDVFLAMCGNADLRCNA